MKYNTSTEERHTEHAQRNDTQNIAFEFHANYTARTLKLQMEIKSLKIFPRQMVKT
jgi:hypothetical protein